MKGIESSLINGEGMTNKPIITCAGDWNLFCTFEAPLVAAIPQDAWEWKRSQGRAIKSVCLEAAFVQYSKELLLAENTKNILKRPIFHIYWTDCSDIEYYKTTLREDIEIWLRQLSQKEITHWMIVLVETYDIRKTNKLLPRTTVLDKIRADFGNRKNEDRFISVINPIKSESRSAESWRGLVSRIREFVLFSYDKSLSKFEEFVREQRDSRNDPNWDFCSFFALQEQLAFVYEMLTLYDEALVQYDELDALFTQSILNSTVTEIPKWLVRFQQQIVSWQAVKLGPTVPSALRDLIYTKNATLLEFRSYLFQRQCSMLLLHNLPWEMASRCLSTVQNTLKELSLLEIQVPEGGTACWALMLCTETLRALERLSATSGAALSQYTAQQAPLYHYAKDKLYELGKLCGLLPGMAEPSSEQLHLVLMLSSGMGDVEVGHKTPSPVERLKEALGSKTSFQHYYLELAELAMGTYKHVGRLRFARLIGRELASFYSELNETGKAAVFLTDALRCYQEEGWKELAAQTTLELLACAQSMKDWDRYTKLSATIASSAELEILVRNFYFDEMLKCIKKNLAHKQETVLTELNDCFKLISASLVPTENCVYVTDNKVECCLTFESFLPRELLCSKAMIAIEQFKCDGQKSAKNSLKKTELVCNSPKKGDVVLEDVNLVSSIKLETLKPKNNLLTPLQITSQYHYKEDKTIDKVTVECLNPKSTLRRSNSNQYRKPSTTTRQDFTNCMVLENFLIKPGLNEILFEKIVKTQGTFKLGQFSLIVENALEFLSNDLIAGKIGYDVVIQGVNVYLNKVDPKRDLVAGLEHAMELVVTSGSSHIQENATINLKTSNGLVICFETENSEQMRRELSIQVPKCKPFETIRVPLRLFAQLQNKKDKDKSLEHMVWLNCPWWDTITEVPLHFSPPFTASWRLLTSHTRKFISVTLKCSVSQLTTFCLTRPALLCDNNVSVADLNPANTEHMFVSSDGTTASFMWELLTDPLVKGGPLKSTFTVQYRPVSSIEPFRSFVCAFDIQDYSTLFLVRTKLEPTKGSDFCRASHMCYLQLSVQRINETEYTSLMYEVLADQTMWAVCGRTAGVITIEPDSSEAQCVVLDVMPLVAGYLPLPTVRLSKYIAAGAKDVRKSDIIPSSGHPRLEPFSPGQVYHAGKALQVHVLAATPKDQPELIS